MPSSPFRLCDPFDLGFQAALWHAEASPPCGFCLKRIGGLPGSFTFGRCKFPTKTIWWIILLKFHGSFPLKWKTKQWKIEVQNRSHEDRPWPWPCMAASCNGTWPPSVRRAWQIRCCKFPFRAERQIPPIISLHLQRGARISGQGLHYLSWDQMIFMNPGRWLF